MFRKQFFFFFSLWALFAFLFGWIFKETTLSERETYFQMMLESTSGKEKKGTYKAQQTRFNVSKQIFLTKGPNRLQIQLSSPLSDLHFEQENGKNALVEHFKDISCLMQEQFLDDKQVIRQIAASSASYHYNSENLFAEQVQLSRSICQGNKLIKPFVILSPLMSGKAKSLQLSLSSPDQPFKAKELEATFQEIP